MGRPTKLEGNPEHPASLGATDVFGQASVLGSTTRIGRAPSRPRRSQDLERVPRPRAASPTTQRPLRSGAAPADRAGHVAVARRQIQTLWPLPEAKWHQWDAVYGACRAARRRHALYKFDNADVVVSLDADFLGFGPGAVRYTKDFSSRRRMGTPSTQLNRLYVVEPVPTITGSKADHRLAMKARDVHAFAAAVAAGVGVQARRPARSLRPGRSGLRHRRRSARAQAVGRRGRRPTSPRPSTRRARDERGARQRRHDGHYTAPIAPRRPTARLRSRTGRRT